MKENIEAIQYASFLYDFYGTLLGESQSEVMMMYHEDNLSLSEIADELGMTRQAVHYTLKKAESKLEEYEEKLKLVEAYKENQIKAEKAIDLLDKLEISDSDRKTIVSIIKELAD